MKKLHLKEVTNLPLLLVNILVSLDFSSQSVNWRPMTTPIPSGFFIFVLAITAPYYLLCFILYISRINKFPITHRLPYIALIELFCFGSSGLVIAMGAGFPGIPILSNCVRSSGVFVINEIIGMVCIMNRIMWIWHKDFLTKLMLKYQKEFIGMQVTVVDQSDVEIKSYMPVFVEKLMVWLAMRGVKLYHAAVPLTMVALGLGTAMIVAWGKEAVLIPNAGCYDSECYLIFEAVVKYHMAFYIIAGVSLAFLFLPLVNMHDNFSIAVEMKLFLGISVLFIGIVFSTATKESTYFVIQQTNIWPFMTCLIVPVFVFTFQGYYIIYLSYKHERSAGIQANTTATRSSDAAEGGKRKRPNLAEELKFLLSTAEGKSLFQEFNRSEFSVENLLFYEACLNYENSYKSNEEGGASEESIKMAKNIQETFVMTTSPLSVNISHDVRAKILKKFGIKIQGKSDTFNTMTRTFSNNHLEDEELKEHEAIKGGGASNDGGALAKKASSRSNLGGVLKRLATGGGDIKLQGLTAVVFNPARDEIFYLMATDTFQRFKITKQYRNYLESTAPILDIRPSPPSFILSPSFPGN
jgi:hypothetical protein